MSLADPMAEIPRHRHRLGVLPGLASATTNSSSPFGNIEEKNNNQLVPISPPVLPEIGKGRMTQYDGINFGKRSSGINDQTFISTSQVQNVTSRLSAVEEANKALLEEIYRLQSYVRTLNQNKKENEHGDKKLHHDVMEAIRGSNDIISELTSRLRTLEEKLHIEKENRKTLSSLSKKLEQSIIASQQEVHSQEDKHGAKLNDLRGRLDEVNRNIQRSDRTSQGIVEEFHQLKSKFDMQSLEFTHMQSEIRQRTKRQDDETKEALMQARYQKDSNSLSEQSLLQMRQFFESRIAELRDSLSDVRGRIGQSEAENRSQEQQNNLKIAELQNQMTEQLRHRQEELQSLQRTRQEKEHVEETERNKLTMKIQAAVEEMSERLLQKEVRLREEALRKFVDLERILQTEQSHRLEHEKQMREDNDKRWNMQQTVLQEEMQAIKEMHRSERSKHAMVNRQLEENVHNIQKSLAGNRKSLEKVLMAEITKREAQSKNMTTQVESLQEQLRVALSSLQQAIGGLQFQVNRDKEQFTNDVKEKLTDEMQRVNRGLTDADARITALSVRITHQEDTVESRVSEMSNELRKEQKEAIHNTEEWRDNLTKDLSNIHETLTSFPQEIKEMQERFDTLKGELELRTQLETDDRLKEAESTGFKIRALTARMESVEVSGKEDHSQLDNLEKNYNSLHRLSGQLERLVNDVRSNLNVRLNSETKMRLEELAAIKREMARLRLDVQPLLWKQAITSRKFVKKESNLLNEWGIYQCARWHDIKMRWMRMLSRARRRKRTQRQPAQYSDLSNESMNDMNLHSGSANGQSEAEDLLPSRSEGDLVPQTSAGKSDSHPESPTNEEWYNQENAGLPLNKNSDQGEGRMDNADDSGDEPIDKPVDDHSSLDEEQHPSEEVIADSLPDPHSSTTEQLQNPNRSSQSELRNSPSRDVKLSPNQATPGTGSRQLI